MKRSCKNIDLTNWRTVEPWVYKCILKHKDRRDFRNLICGIGQMNKRAYKAALQNHDKAAFILPAQNIAKEASKRIRERNLNLPPVVYREYIDQSSHKSREIGKECAFQQVFGYIAKEAANPIWKRRIVPQQVSSIEGRGQIVGTKIIQNWAVQDNHAAAWAAAHGTKYTRKCKYIVKIDIKKCFPSMRLETFLNLFKKDCGNKDLIWLWQELLSSHRTEDYQGFMIGSLPSQWAAQYMLSFVYRFAMNLHKFRRGKRIKRVKKMILYMDDMQLAGSSRKDLKYALQEIIKYASNMLGLSIKPDWHILKWERAPTDMMGYRTHRNGGITIRPRIFLRLRRAALRFMRSGWLSIGQARRVCSYKGFVKPSKRRKVWLNLRVRKICKKLKLEKLFTAAAKTVSIFERRRNHDRILHRGPGGSHVYAVA